jgi:hypothetical protein
MGPFMIQSANGALTMDISHAIYSEGTGILGYPPGGGGASPIQPNQSWDVINDPLDSSHFLIVSQESGLCIGIGRNLPADANNPDANAPPPANANFSDDATDRGMTLTLQVQEPINNSYQLWDFLPPTGGSGNSVFIQNPDTGYVIEVESHSTTACPLVVNPRRISNDTFQLWIAVDQDGQEVGLPVVSMAPYPGPAKLHGFDSYVFVPPNQGDNVIGLSVTIDVIEDILVESQTESPGAAPVDGFSLQINCNTPYTGTIGTATEDEEDFDRQAQWMQFGMFMQNNQLVLFNQIWHRLGQVPSGEFPSITETSAPFLQLQNNTIPAGTRIIMNICTDQTDFAMGITGLALDITGLPIGPAIYWPALGQPSYHSTIDGGKVHQRAMAPIGAFQVLFCCIPGEAVADQFTSGMGTITITASPGIAPLQGSLPNPNGIATAENSNMPYDLVPSATARLIAQPFGLRSMTSVPPIHPKFGDTGYGAVIIEEPGGLVEVFAGIGPGPPTVFNDDPGSPGYGDRS